MRSLRYLFRILFTLTVTSFLSRDLLIEETNAYTMTVTKQIKEKVTNKPISIPVVCHVPKNMTINQ